jgi:hypothetical protein
LAISRVPVPEQSQKRDAIGQREFRLASRSDRAIARKLFLDRRCLVLRREGIDLHLESRLEEHEPCLTTDVEQVEAAGTDNPASFASLSNG